jgi:hypothetical protein
MSVPAGQAPRMNRHLTELAFVLDRSGSMSSMAADAIEGFNFFLHEQQHAQGHARLTLVLFDDEYLIPIESIPVGEVVPLDHTTYVPRNTTALLDAIGRTIDELGARLKALPEAARPGKVIVTILTDGLENASVHETWHTVSQRIRHQTAQYAWEFLFLGANQDAIATAAQLHIAAANAATYHADGIGIRSTARSISRKSSALRARAAGVANLEEEQAAAAPMQEIVQEEDRKTRGEP